MAQQVKRDYLNPRVLARLAPLALHARHPMLGNVSGRHRSPIRGSSIEFSAYRKYVPGDDTRRLDWRAYARSDRYYVKEFEADTNLRMCLIVDTSGSMQFGIENTTKLDYARRIAGTLAYLASHQGDAVGLRCAGMQSSVDIPPRRSAAHLRNVLDQLGHMEPGGETFLVEALQEVAEGVPQRALIIVISDLFVDTAQLRKCIEHLRFRKHDVALFHLLEQSELDFKFDRPVRFVDLEGGPPLLTDPVTVARQYRRSLENYLEQIKAFVLDLEIDYHRVCISEAYDDVLARFLLGRTPKKSK